MYGRSLVLFPLVGSLLVSIQLFKSMVAFIITQVSLLLSFSLMEPFLFRSYSLFLLILDSYSIEASYRVEGMGITLSHLVAEFQDIVIDGLTIQQNMLTSSQVIAILLYDTSVSLLPSYLMCYRKSYHTTIQYLTSLKPICSE